MASSRILGTGHYVPPKVVTNFDVMKMMDTTNEFIVERTGVLRRRHAEAGVSASDLGVFACRAAVEDAGLEMDAIDLLIMNTITPDHADPGCAFFLQGKLGLPGIAVMDIRQQCAGLIYGLSIADHFVRAGTYRHVLIACSEVLSKRIDGSYDGRNIAILLETARGPWWWVRRRRKGGGSCPRLSTPMDGTRRRSTPPRPAARWAGGSTSRRRISTLAGSTSEWTGRPCSSLASRRCPMRRSKPCG